MSKSTSTDILDANPLVFDDSGRAAGRRSVTAQADGLDQEALAVPEEPDQNRLGRAVGAYGGEPDEPIRT